MKQLNEVYFYGPHARRNQNTEHAKVLRYFTNKWKTRFDYRKSLSKKVSLNTFFCLNKDIFFVRKKVQWDMRIF